MQKKDNERRETKNAIIYITFVDIETHMRNATGKNIHRNGNLVHVCVRGIFLLASSVIR